MKRLTVALLALASLPALAAPLPFAPVRAGDPTLPASVPLDYVSTPDGYFHPSCVQFVDPSERLEADGSLTRADGSRRRPAPCAHPRYTRAGLRVEPGVHPVRPPQSDTDYDGYLAYVTAVLTTGADEMTGYITVPPVPATQGEQTVYLFPGLEDHADVVSILQPVLGWNPDGAATGQTWTITPWNCCRRGTVYYGPTQVVAAGDLIYGSMTLGAKDTWTITVTDASNTSIPPVSLASRDRQPQTWVFGAALETYGVTECSQLPAGPIAFDSILVYVKHAVLASPPWTTNTGGSAGCAASATIVGPQTLAID
jgi:hypothetical protein